MYRIGCSKMVNEDQKKILEKNVWAVVGASEERSKYGNKVYRHLRNNDYKVYPINPSLDKVEGDKAYDHLEDLPETPDVVNFVVRPMVTNNKLPKLKDLGIDYAWAQPGASNDKSQEIAQENDIKLVRDECVLVQVPLKR